MGSQSIQSKLWGQRPGDWATLQEPTGKVGYEYALNFIKLKTTDKLLDVGCGTGYFANLASASGANITGFDATAAFIEEAKLRNSSIHLLTGEMEELPFADQTFDVVTGFNSFQYAANIKNALLEAKRVLKNNGKFVAMIWGNKEECEAALYLKAIGSLMPPPPAGAPGPFALSENHLLENILAEIGLQVLNSADVDSIWEYPNMDTAVKGLLSAGPIAKAIEFSGYDKVLQTTLEVAKPYTQNNGHIIFKNKFRVVIAEK